MGADPRPQGSRKGPGKGSGKGPGEESGSPRQGGSRNAKNAATRWVVHNNFNVDGRHHVEAF